MTRFTNREFREWLLYEQLEPDTSTRLENLLIKVLMEIKCWRTGKDVDREDVVIRYDSIKDTPKVLSPRDAKAEYNRLFGAYKRLGLIHEVTTDGS